MIKFLVNMMVFASLVGAGASGAFAQTVPTKTSNTNRFEAEVRRLNVEEVDAFLHNDPKAI